MWISASPSDYDNFSTSASTIIDPWRHEELHFTFPISFEEYKKQEAEKELARLRECKMRNKLKRKGMFTKKGLY